MEFDTKVKIFLAYSREDSAPRVRLEKHLSSLKRAQYIDTWYDGEIAPGALWENEIKAAIKTSDIILLLISADFIASDYCYNVEMNEAVKRHINGDCIVVPILLSPCGWELTPLSAIQFLPKNGHPITSNEWISPDYAFNEVAKEVRQIVQNIRKKKKELAERVNSILIEKKENMLFLQNEIERLELKVRGLKDKERIIVENDNLKLENIKLKHTNDSLRNDVKKLNENLLKISNIYQELVERSIDNVLNDEKISKNSIIEIIDEVNLPTIITKGLDELLQFRQSLSIHYSEHTFNDILLSYLYKDIRFKPSARDYDLIERIEGKITLIKKIKAELKKLSDTQNKAVRKIIEV